MPEPIPNQDPQVVAAWSAVAGAYADLWGPRFRPFLEQALAAFAPGEGDLGVPGCGPGDEVLELAARFPGRRIVASDPAAPMRELLEARLAAGGVSAVRVEPGAAVALPEVLQGAGGVFSSFALQLLPDRWAALQAWVRCLAPGGQLMVLFWPRQSDDDAWGRLGRAIERVSGQPRPDWVPALERRLPELDLRLERCGDLQHPIRYASPEQAWAALRDACSLQVLLRRLGPEAAEACGRAWLGDHGLEQEPQGWTHRPRARLWVLRRR